MTKALFDLPSPNNAPRDAPVDVLVLHYTELPLQESLHILRDSDRSPRVSAHYVLAECGSLYRLVPEDRVAWHSGLSHWRGRDLLNGASIGIEIVNLHGDRHDYPDVQIEILIELCREIRSRHPAIADRNVVGHSDIAPRRKIDPGVRFPWRRLSQAGVGLWPKAGAHPIEGDMPAALRLFGYPSPDPASNRDASDIVASFQRHYRPSCIDGVADRETRSLLADLLDQVGGAP